MRFFCRVSHLALCAPSRPPPRLAGDRLLPRSRPAPSPSSPSPLQPFSPGALLPSSPPLDGSVEDGEGGLPAAGRGASGGAAGGRRCEQDHRPLDGSVEDGEGGLPAARRGASGGAAGSRRCEQDHRPLDGSVEDGEEGLPAAGRGASGGAAGGRRCEQDGCSRYLCRPHRQTGRVSGLQKPGGGVASGLPVQLRDTRSPTAGAHSAWGRPVTSASARRRGSAGISQWERKLAARWSFQPEQCTVFSLLLLLLRSAPGAPTRAPGVTRSALRPEPRPVLVRPGREGSTKAEGLCSQPSSCKDWRVFS